MGLRNVPDVLRNRDFNLYWAGVVLSQIGTRATVAANLYHVYHLTGSIAQTGLVGAGQAFALLVLSPLGGVLADRWDRRRLLQASQAVAMVVAGGLAIATLTGHIVAWQVVLSVVLTTAASTFDQPARQALIPALVPRVQLPQAFALINPSREVAVLLGPAIAGILIAFGGPGLVYAVDAVTYAALVVVLQLLRVPSLEGAGTAVSIWRQLVDGVAFVRGRRMIWMLMSLDLSATIFGAYRVLLPALCATVFHVGPQGYGLLSAAPSAGALLATYTIFRVVDRTQRLGRVLLIGTVLYGVSNVFLAQAHLFWIAVLAGLLIGACDAMATTIRQAAVQLETPDELRGRVSAIYQMASRGGPALGDTLMGGVAGLLGPVFALTVGGALAGLYAGSFLVRANPVLTYTGVAGERAAARAPTGKPPESG
ncbi:MFS transporter [Mycobacterium sp. AT1]|uniref:MFS transporter n=1 Tax=Mycobacterium sp. AT1 TaxID=1961706 RepID=UPI0009AE56B6|nr:MFS transporter [Mycobacterium sp. AT1]OPX09600.1 MFS transporter [Mycobacterium sp. AT1]